jgi:hypothetical protein
MGLARDTFVRHVLGALEVASLPANVSFVEGAAADALRGADVLLYNTTSVSYEALAAGVPIVFVASDYWFDVDPIPPASDVKNVARTPEEIRTAVDYYADEGSAAAAARHEQARALLGDAFA